MSLSFCCKLQMVGSGFSISDVNAGTHPARVLLLMLWTS